mmetsp:Transcript_110224/g.351306  ORF Transcript_110224/g.351306 Transcript_110224/m.351306 type:complete len:312 (-) Transcript_110224:3379-4314(-)
MRGLGGMCAFHAKRVLPRQMLAVANKKRLRRGLSNFAREPLLGRSLRGFRLLLGTTVSRGNPDRSGFLFKIKSKNSIPHLHHFNGLVNLHQFSGEHHRDVIPSQSFGKNCNCNSIVAAKDVLDHVEQNLAQVACALKHLEACMLGELVQERQLHVPEPLCCSNFQELDRTVLDDQPQGRLQRYSSFWQVLLLPHPTSALDRATHHAPQVGEGRHHGLLGVQVGLPHEHISASGDSHEPTWPSQATGPAEVQQAEHPHSGIVQLVAPEQHFVSHVHHFAQPSCVDQLEVAELLALSQHEQVCDGDVHVSRRW